MKKELAPHWPRQKITKKYPFGSWAKPMEKYQFMRNLSSKIAQHPPRWIRFFWRRWLLAATGRMLRKEGINRLVCYDIGARGGIWERFYLLPLPVHIVGFEADAQEAERLAKAGAFDTVVPVALSAAGGQKTLHLARQSGCSSFYKPDMQVIERHCGSEDFCTIHEVTLETMKLQEAIKSFKLPPPDYVKLDVEGAEFEILTGMEESLENCSGVFFEARLARFYTGEALFGGVSDTLIEHGFSIVSFEPVGSFCGAVMLVDSCACRNPRVENRKANILKAAAFALVVDNFEFALACLRKVASKKEILFG